MDLEHERRLTEVEDRSKSNTRRIEKVESQQSELSKLVTSVQLLAKREEIVENDVKEIKSDVKSIAGKPAKRWDSIVTTIITALAAAFIAYILTKLGL